MRSDDYLDYQYFLDSHSALNSFRNQGLYDKIYGRYESYTEPEGYTTTFNDVVVTALRPCIRLNPGAGKTEFLALEQGSDIIVMSGCESKGSLRHQFYFSVESTPPEAVADSIFETVNASFDDLKQGKNLWEINDAVKGLLIPIENVVTVFEEKIQPWMR